MRLEPYPARMNDAPESHLRERFARLRGERERLADVVTAYRAVRASRFSRMDDLTRALKRALFRLDEPAALAVVDLPALPAHFSD